MERKKASNSATLRNACWRGGKPLLAIVSLGLAISAWAEDPATKLRTNPFLRPALTAGAPVPTDSSGPAHSKAPPSHLRFTLAAGPDSLVNVDGRTLRIGEEINGYRLEAVRADTAIFSNGEEVIELKTQLKDIRKRK